MDVSEYDVVSIQCVCFEVITIQYNTSAEIKYLRDLTFCKALHSRNTVNILFLQIYIEDLTRVVISYEIYQTSFR